MMYGGMADMGKEEKRGISEEKEETRIVYPSFTIVGDKISEELKNAKLETMHRCEICIKKVGDDIDTYAANQPRRVQVEIHKMGYMGESVKATDDEFKDMTPDERKEYQKKEMEERDHEE